MASTTDRNSVLVIRGYPGDSVSYDTQKQILDKIQATLTDQEVKYEILGRTFTCPMDTIKYRANVLTRGEFNKKVRNLTVILFGEASGTGTKPNTHAVRLDSDGYKGRCQKRGVAYPRLPYLRRGETMLFDVRVPLVIRPEFTTNG